MAILKWISDANACAILYSFVETAKANGLLVDSYFQTCLNELAKKPRVPTTFEYQARLDAIPHTLTVFLPYILLMMIQSALWLLMLSTLSNTLKLQNL